MAQSPPIQDLQRAAVVRPDQEQASRGRLGEYHAERLINRQKGEHIAGLVNPSEIFCWQKTVEAHAIFQAELGCELFEPPTSRARADDMQARRAAALTLEDAKAAQHGV